MSPEKPYDGAAVVSELNIFMENYADILRKREMEKIADLYYDSGIVISGNGFNEFSSFDSIRSHYLKQPRDPINFKWDEIRIDPLAGDLALITSVFYWNFPDKPDTAKFSYTGLLTKTSGGWKIRHEHESRRCSK
jgi:ketosteroid isomerase-like protein